MKNKQKKYQQKLEMLLNSCSFEFDDNLKNILSKISGIYRIFEKDANNCETIYIGKSNNLKRRIYNNHFRGSSSNSTLRRKLALTLSDDEITSYLTHKCCIQFIQIEEENLSCFEHYFIAMLCPKYND